MRAFVYGMIIVMTWISLGSITANAQFTKDTGMFKPRKDAPMVMRIDDKRTLHITKTDSEEWIFCVFKTEFEERLDAVILIKTSQTEYTNLCPIMLVISDQNDGKNSIEFSMGLGDAQQTITIPIVYIRKDDHTRKWLKRGYRRMVANTQIEEATYYQ